MYSCTDCFLQLQIKSVLVSASWINSTLDSFQVFQTLLEVSLLTGRCWYTQYIQLCCCYSVLDVVMKLHGKIAKQGDVSTFYSFEVAVTSKVLSCHGEEYLGLFQVLHFS